MVMSIYATAGLAREASGSQVWKGFADGARVKGHELDRCVSSNVSPLFHLSQFRCPSRPKITGTFLWMALFLDYGCCLFVLFPGFPTLHLNTLTLSLHKS